MSPVYVDLRVLISYPDLLERIADEMLKAVKGCTFDIMCGVPYTALPFATVMSGKNKKPMVMKRKEVKDYGTKKAIEGVYSAGQKVLIVEDLVTSGLSVFETVGPLEKEGLEVEDVVVLLDRGQGGKQNVINRGKKLHSVVTLQEVLAVLFKNGKVDQTMVDKVETFVADNQVEVALDKSGAYSAVTAPPVTFSYGARAAVATNPAGKALLTLIEEKKCNLCLAADVTTTAELLALAKAVGPNICCLKTHCDVVTDWTADTAAQLKALAAEHKFMIFEDRKFADIGNTVVHQCRDGYHQIASWADFVNAHPLPGPGIVDGLKEALKDAPEAGLLLLAEMSSAGNLISADYTKATVAMAEANPDFVFGFISQNKLRESVGPDPFVYMTPGVKMQKEGDGLGQQYNTPSVIIGEKGSDVAIVGRGIYKAEDPAKAAADYAAACWDAYTKRLGVGK